MKNLFHPHPAKKISLSGNKLKIIACVSMFLDHFAKVFQTELDSSLYFVLDNIIGRLAFPLFCLLLAEGYFHTRNLRKYMLRVALLALVSEIPFNLAMSGQFFDPRWQNTVFTLLLGLLMFCFLDIIRSRSDPVRLPAVLLQILTVLASAAAAWFLRTDYDVFGIGALACFYYLNGRIFKSPLTADLWACFCLFQEPAAFLSLLPVAAYNRSRGKRKMKYFFYCFYPLHLLLLVFLHDLIHGRYAL